jgi:6-phosphogluconolactonase (cycloisomerase 2 family)
MDEMTDMSLQQTLSRRNFLMSAAAMAVAPGALGEAQKPATHAKRETLLAYAGSYTIPVDGSGNGEGIYLFEMDVHTGALKNRRLAAKIENPSWIEIHPSRKYLYTINEVTNFRGKNGAVTAYSIDPSTGNLTFINQASTEGPGPAHLSLDAHGKYVFVANYLGGCIAVLPIHDDGSLGAAVDVHHDIGSLGSIHATHASPGSFAISGHDAPHAHMILPDPRNRFVLHTDLGQDRLYIYRFDAATGKLTPAAVPFEALPTGDGPRHFAFHPNGHWLYTVQEEGNTIVFFHYDGEAGAVAAQQTISTLPAGFAGTSYSSEIVISRNGKFLYSANRLHDTIAVFAIGADGKLTHIGDTSTMGDYPRHCRIDPTGNFLFVCNHRGDNITSFRIHPETGLLAFTGHYAPVGSPAVLTFLT